MKRLVIKFPMQSITILLQLELVGAAAPPGVGRKQGSFRYATLRCTHLASDLLRISPLFHYVHMPKASKKIKIVVLTGGPLYFAADVTFRRR